MASYVIYAHDNGLVDPDRHYVQIYLRDPLFGANTWSILTPNTWIGVGSGTYKVEDHPHSSDMKILVCREGRNWRMELIVPEYPHAFSGEGRAWASTARSTATVREVCIGTAPSRSALIPEPTHFFSIGSRYRITVSATMRLPSVVG
jgi:hypothetical protein